MCIRDSSTLLLSTHCLCNEHRGALSFQISVFIFSDQYPEVYFGDQTLVQGIICKYSFPYGWFSFHFNAVFLSLAEAFYFDNIPFVYSFLYVPCSRGHISENIAAWNIWDFPADIFLEDFHGVMTYIWVFSPPCISFCVWCKLVIKFHFFACSGLDLPTPFFEEAIFILFYAPALFVKY